jgi:hypothetical protein
MSGAVDQRARDAADDAMNRIDKHEAVCAERYKRLDDRLAAGSTRMETISGDIKGVKGDIKAAVTKLIAVLLGATGALIGTVFLMLRAAG